MPRPISVRPGSRWSGPTGSSCAPDTGGPSEARRQHLETAVTAVDPTDFPLIAADLAYVRGMAHRQLGEEPKAQIWLSKATINGALIEPAKQALADPALQLVVTDEDAISSRSNKWDVTTELSEQQRQEEGHQERRTELLQEGRALLDNQVGLADVKRAVAELEDQIEVRALRLAAGLPVANQTNHMLLVGPPGTGKTTTAEALGKIYAGPGHRAPSRRSSKSSGPISAGSTSARRDRRPTS